MLIHAITAGITILMYNLLIPYIQPVNDYCKFEIIILSLPCTQPDFPNNISSIEWRAWHGPYTFGTPPETGFKHCNRNSLHRQELRPACSQPCPNGIEETKKSGNKLTLSTRQRQGNAPNDSRRHDRHAVCPWPGDRTCATAAQCQNPSHILNGIRLRPRMPSSTTRLCLLRKWATN